jgi:hypothetical protein
MNVYLNLHQVKLHNNIELHDSIRFLYPKKNTIMNGEFTKILFSKNTVTMNGLYLYIPFKVHDVNENNHIRHLATNNTQNIQLKHDLQIIEEQLLKNYMEYNQIKKKCDYILLNQLIANQIRVYRNHGKKSTNKYVIKISGIWETRDKIGITYKILEL